MDLLKTFNFGGGELVELSHLEKTFNISRQVALKYLKVLHIQPLYINEDVFFSLPTFNRILYVLSRPGSPGFLFPGSSGKTNKRLRDKGFLIEVTNEILNEANSPRVLAEMAAADGRDTSMVKKLITHPSAEKGKK